MREIIKYQTQGTCCKMMQVEVEDNKVVNAEFLGGCNGNLKGIRSLIIGMDIDEVIKRLEGIPCGGKSTSCPDQLAKCLVEYRAQKANRRVCYGNPGKVQHHRQSRQAT